jgi:hypothetical protein
MPDEVWTIVALLKLAKTTVDGMAQASQIPAYKIRGQ